MNIIPTVQSHTRKSSKGKTIRVSRHWRRKRTVTKIPIRTDNDTIKVSSADYDPVSKESNIAYVDEDDKKIDYHMINAPMKVESVTLDEQGNLGMIEELNLKGKNKKITSVHIEQPKDF